MTLTYMQATADDRLKHAVNGKVILLDDDPRAEIPNSYMVMNLDEEGFAVDSKDGLTLEEAQKEMEAA